MKTQVVAGITIAKVTREFTFTIDWDGVTQEDLQAWATRSIVIAKQNQHRTANKGAGSWPTEAECNIKATDFRIGVRRPVVQDPVKLIEGGSLSTEELDRLGKLIAQKLAAAKAPEAKK